MGNCLRRESSTQCGGESPERFFTTKKKHEKQGKEVIDMEEKALLNLGDHHQMQGLTTGSSTRAKSSTEVKIKISKKQLEELLGRVDMKELSVEQVLAQLMNVSSQPLETHQRSWRPNLQSIPE